MKSVAGNIDFMEGLGLVEDKEDSLDTATNVSADATFVPSHVKAFESSMLDAYDYDLLCNMWACRYECGST